MNKILIICFIFIVNLKADVHTFLLENDTFAGTDKHYTNGVFYTIMDDRSESAFTLAQTMFTPEDIAESKKILNDSPYAGHIELRYSKFFVNGNFLHNIGIAIGSVGPVSMAEQTQIAVHEARKITIPEGWDHQLENDATAGVHYQVAARTKKLKFKGISFDWTNSLRLDGGNFYSGGVISTVLRFGNYFPKNFQTSGSFLGGHESSMINFKNKVVLNGLFLMGYM